jgi:hypothetical protein
MRLGYFNESDLKGARNFSLGAGFKYNVKVDVSIYFQHQKVKSFRKHITFLFNLQFGDKYDEY